MGLATGIGRMEVGWETVGAVILGKLGFAVPALDRTTEVVIWGISLSRVVLSGLVGASLAAAGVVFQGLLLNPLADPFTIGVSTGAAFGVALLVMLGVGGSFLGLSPLPLGALAGALAAMVAVLVLSRESGAHPQGILDPGGDCGEHLSVGPHQPDQKSGRGIPVGHRLLDHGEFLRPGLDSRGLSAALRGPGPGPGRRPITGNWTSWPWGKSSPITWGWPSPGCGSNSCWAPPCSPPGPCPSPGSSALWAWWCPTWCGSWPAPPMAGLLVLSALTGALILIWADVVARILLAGGQELPVGVVTALLGGPFFFYLLKSRRTRGMW